MATTLAPFAIAFISPVKLTAITLNKLAHHVIDVEVLAVFAVSASLVIAILIVDKFGTVYTTVLTLAVLAAILAANVKQVGTAHAIGVVVHSVPLMFTGVPPPSSMQASW